MLGATALGLTCRDAVILAADKRVSYGSYVVSERGKKVFMVTGNVGAACAGLMADSSKVVEYLKAYVKLYEAEKKSMMSVKGSANLLSAMLFSRRLLPFYTQVLIGGVDWEGPQLYGLDPVGSLIPDKFIAIGSGTEIATGILEKEYREGLTVEEGLKLVRKVMGAVTRRDAITGREIDVLIIRKEKSEEKAMKVP